MRSSLIVILFFSFNVQAQIQFSNQAEALGAGISYGLLEFGAGISFYDYNNDGWDDITLAGSNTKGFQFLRNEGGNFVVDNLNINNNNAYIRQINWVDYDNDGDNDFFAVSFTDFSRLYRNEGNGVFTDVTLAAGFSGVVYDTFGSSWGDYNNDGFLDVFLSIRDTNLIIPNLLYRNNGDGTFTNVTIEAGLEEIGFFSLCAAFFDYNNDGYQDIFIANDKYDYPNLCYLNNGDGTFLNQSVPSGTGIYMDAMSTAISDIDNNGFLDVYVTNTYPAPPGEIEGNVFFYNNGNETFTNIAPSNGTTFDSDAWGAVFLDADNDRDADLYVSGSEDGSMGLPSAFYENDGNGNFTIPANAGFANDTRESYANAIGDIDNDGYPEIIVMNNDGDNIFLWKNDTPQNNNWLKVNLEGTVSNRMGVGSWIEISAGGEIQFQYTLCGEGYLGQNSGTEFFGLEDATQVDYVKVTWLSGIVDYFENVNVNTTIDILEGSTLGEADQQKGRFRMYPNPAKDQAHLFLEKPFNTTIRIFTETGKLIQEYTFADQHITLPLNGLSAGVYFIQLRTEAFVETRKLIKI